MKSLSIFTTAEQVAKHLREEILRGTWIETMPGAILLAKKLGVGVRTISEALQQLEQEGLLVNQGNRKKRKIIVPKNATRPGLRVAILLYQFDGKGSGLQTGLLLQLLKEGHQAIICNKTLNDLGMKANRVSRYVNSIAADAWIIFTAPQEVLDFFIQQPTPVFAVTGRPAAKDIASAVTAKKKIIPEVVRHLVSLGHRRIVYLSRTERHTPQPEVPEQSFLDEMEAQGIATGSYNLPDWPSNAEGLQKCLDSLFKVTPPTALFLEESSIFYAVQHYLGQHGLSAPRDISLVCNESNDSFTWCRPSVAHISWDHGHLQQRIVKWANKLARGVNDSRTQIIKAAFHNGGTIGPAPSKRRT